MYVYSNQLFSTFPISKELYILKKDEDGFLS